MLSDVATLVLLNKNRSLRSTTGFPACKAGDLTMIFVENSIFVIVEHAYLQLKWMEHQEKTQTSKATIVALPERGEYFSKFKNGW